MKYRMRVSVDFKNFIQWSDSPDVVLFDLAQLFGFLHQVQRLILARSFKRMMFLFAGDFDKRCPDWLKRRFKVIRVLFDASWIKRSAIRVAARIFCVSVVILAKGCGRGEAPPISCQPENQNGCARLIWPFLHASVR